MLASAGVRESRSRRRGRSALSATTSSRRPLTSVRSGGRVPREGPGGRRIAQKTSIFGARKRSIRGARLRSPALPKQHRAQLQLPDQRRAMPRRRERPADVAGLAAAAAAQPARAAGVVALAECRCRAGRCRKSHLKEVLRRAGGSRCRLAHRSRRARPRHRLRPQTGVGGQDQALDPPAVGELAGAGRPLELLAQQSAGGDKRGLAALQKLRFLAAAVPEAPGPWPNGPTLQQPLHFVPRKPPAASRSPSQKAACGQTPKLRAAAGLRVSFPAEHLGPPRFFAVRQPMRRTSPPREKALHASSSRRSLEILAAAPWSLCARNPAQGTGSRGADRSGVLSRVLRTTRRREPVRRRGAGSGKRVQIALGRVDDLAAEDSVGAWES